MPITHIRVVTVYVTDQAASLAFYRDKLGFEVRREADMGGMGKWIEVAPKGSTESIIMLGDAAKFEHEVGGFAPCTLECDDADATHAELAANGVELEPITDEHWGRHFFALDLDGNRFLIRETPKG